MSYEEIQIALIGGTTDGKTTFFTSMIECMVSTMVRLKDGHSIRLRPIEMRKGLNYTGGTNQPIVEEKEVEHKSVNELDAIMNNLASIKPPVNNSQKENNALISVDSENSVESTIKLQRALDDLFSFPRAGGIASNATATNRYITMKFDVLVDSVPVCKLVIVDYAGEIVDLKKDTLSALLLKNYAKQVTSCDASIIFANANKLTKVVNQNPREGESIFNVTTAKAELNVDNVTTVITTAKEKSPFTYIVAISQTENPNVAPIVKMNNYRDAQRCLQEHIYEVLYDTAKHNRDAHGKALPWATGMLPIDAFGKDCVDENNKLKPDCDFKPIGIDKAILYCLYNVSLVYDEQLKKEIDNVHVPILPGKEKKAALSKKAYFTELQKSYAALRTAITSDEHYFSDVYETEYFKGNGDPRFPNRKSADIVGVN